MTEELSAIPIEELIQRLREHDEADLELFELAAEAGDRLEKLEAVRQATELVRLLFPLDAIAEDERARYAAISGLSADADGIFKSHVDTVKAVQRLDAVLKAAKE